jgi:hypothetical protein
MASIRNNPNFVIFLKNFWVDSTLEYKRIYFMLKINVILIGIYFFLTSNLYRLAYPIALEKLGDE